MWIAPASPSDRARSRFQQPLGPLIVEVPAPPEVVFAVEEEYLLDPAESGTTFTYRGTLGSNLPVLDGWWARANARTWTEVVRASVTDIAAEAARRHR